MDIHSVLLLRVSSVVDKVDHPQFFDPSYPLKTLQAGLQQYPDMAVHIHDCWIHTMGVPQLLEHIAQVQPDVVVVSASSFDIDVANTFVSALKAQDHAPVAIGIGQGYYLMRDTKSSETTAYDAILLGEPEQELLGWVARMRRGEASIWDWRAHYRQCYEEGRRFEVEAPDDLPFPSYSADELQAYKSIYPVQLSQRAVWGFLIATRGCPYACTFCSEVMRVSIGTKLRGRTPANVADEMEHLAQQGVNICSFQDDSFSSNRKFVRALCEELVARGSKMPWMARVRVDEVDYDVLALMKRAGCVMLGLGVESGSQRLIDEMLKTYNSKPWLERCRQTFRWARELGIGTNAYYIIGNPTETRAEIEQTIDLALELNSDTIQVHFYTPYPGSSDWERYKYLLESYDLTQMFHYATPMFSVADVSVEELLELRSKFYRRYLFRPRFMLGHLWRHAGFYWHNPDVFWSLVGIRKVL
jgi:anaerobic magnesium-protoporphyrin IX monomethyl ester cyclase